MSHAHHGQRQHHHPHRHHAHHPQQPQHHAVQRRPAKVHPLVIIARGNAVRSFTLRPWLTAFVGIGALLFMAAYIAATGYLVLRDDLISASVGREQNMRQAYEDRIAELRSQVDRVSSRQLLSQDAVDSKMQKIMSRQAAISARQNQLADIKAAAERAGVDTGGRASGSAAVDPTTTGSVKAPGHASAEPMTLRGNAAEEKLAGVERSLDVIERDQAAMVMRVADRATAKVNQITSVLGDISHKVDIKTVKGGAMGGPYIPAKSAPDPKSGTFREKLAFAAQKIDQLNVVKVAIRRLPLARPLPSLAISSNFGSRSDPFLGSKAYHAGTDFMSEQGMPISATAPGTVTEAGWNGGYGNMVEINHGNGIVTRYGHMSKILVKAGQKVDIGTKIGLVGTTGRSTGPHLHYEVRVEGDAIDPMPFIRAGTELRGII
jgi:murein DD-endopeptidase MepM/ murein hydrolase activator NlpD